MSSPKVWELKIILKNCILHNSLIYQKKKCKNSKKNFRFKKSSKNQNSIKKNQKV